YSLLSSMLSLSKIKEVLENMNYKAYAITDNAMHGAYKFYKLCKSNNIKPIIGLRLNLYNQNFDNMVLLYAKNMEGYISLMKISSQYEINKEEVTKEFLQLNNKGILAIIPVFENEINIYYQNKDTSAIKDCVLEYKNIFEDLYFGLSLNSNYERQNIDNFLNIAKNYMIKAVAINRSCYFDDDDIDAYKILRMVALNEKESDNKEILKEEDYHLSFLSAYDIELKFSSYLELLKNTEEIEAKCNLELNYQGYYFPKAIIEAKENPSSKEYLYSLALVGLKKRLKQLSLKKPNYLNKGKIEEYKNRLFYELSIIDKMGFNDYFLIVYEYVKYAKTHDIMVGPGRGSAGGSLVSFSLGITDVDPIEYDLLFERFLNPERVGMPDIDVDFEDERRELVIQHMMERYGNNKVAHITTFGTYKAKLAIRDVSRIVDLKEFKLKEVMKFISSTLSIDESINNSPMLANMIKSDEEIQRVIKIAKKIEGLPKNYSTHAAGIIMADTKLYDYTPLQQGINGLYQTQYEAADLEEIGLVKMDILGLRNLSIIKNVLRNIKEKDNIDLDIRNIDLNDYQTYKNIASGNTLGIFQLEGAGVTNVLKSLKTSNLEDVIAATALYRPGPMEMIPSFIKRKFKQEAITYLDESMKDILTPTNGIIVYQEQIMKIASSYAGYTLGEADILRRAISKKKAKVIEEERIKFVDKAIKNGKDKKNANAVYDYIEKFASYGFNRSHAVAYAIIAYQMAFLKTHFYKAFLSALMTNAVGSVTSISQYISEARRYKVNVLPPSINKSNTYFAYDDKGIYYSLLGISNIGSQTVDAILKIREDGLFISYTDFIDRTKNILNQKLISMLVFSGALDEFLEKDGITRKYMNEHYEENLQKIAYANILNIHIGDNDDKEEYNFVEMSEYEKEALGFNLKYNMFIKYQNVINKYHCVSFNDLKEGIETNCVFVIKRIREIKTKNGEYMAFLTVSDDSMNINDNVVMFPSIYSSNKHLLEVNQAYIGKIKLEIRKDKNEIKESLSILAISKL
ncbi:MAG: DNA polymerase III subunit alpha, partial [Bacilli bacterium]|nr:DNA polymerase III subunit alpha [Bacilli bacterium]